MINLSNLKILSINNIPLVRLLANGVEIWRKFINWVSYSTESGGTTPYNGGLGYKAGYRLNSSGGETSAANSTCVGFIPCKGGDTIRFKGYPWGQSDSNESNPNLSYIIVYDSSFTKLYTGNGNKSYAWSSFIETFETIDGVATFKFKNLSSIKYFRINFCANSSGAVDGSKFIVTVNEEII